MKNIIMDGKALQVPDDYTILAAARHNDIEIPTLCYLKHVSHVASCRVCVVEVEGMEKLPTACNTIVEEGMVIHTQSDRVIASRKMALNLLLSNHHQDCFSCASNGVCELQKVCNDYGVAHSTFDGSRYKIESEEKNSNPFLGYRPTLCIHCHRCVNTCAKVSGRNAIKVGKTGMFNVIDAPFGPDWESTKCESCGNCAEACPTGALYKKRGQELPQLGGAPGAYDLPPTVRWAASMTCWSRAIRSSALRAQTAPATTAACASRDASAPISS